MLKRTFIALAALAAAGAVLAQAYRWVDEEGVVHYSDRPREGAERITLPSDYRVPQPAQTSAAAAFPTGGDEEREQQQKPFAYEVLEVGSPSAEETLWNIEGVLNVSLNIRPALQPGHQVRVYFDGEPRMVSGSQFQIEEVYRGVHNLQAEIVDETGKLMKRSLPNRFYVQQNSIVNPSRPVNPR